MALSKAFGAIGKVATGFGKKILRKIKPAGITRGGVKSSPKGLAPDTPLTSGKRFSTQTTKRAASTIPTAQKGVSGKFIRKVVIGSAVVGGGIFGGSKLFKSIRTDFVEGRSGNVQADIDLSNLERATQTGEDFDELSREGQEFANIGASVVEGRGGIGGVGIGALVIAGGLAAFLLLRKKKGGKK